MKFTNCLLTSVLLLVGVAAPYAAHADTAAPENLFRTFSACDRTFFERLNAEQKTWTDYMRIGTRGNVAYPVVPNRLREGQRIQLFEKPIDMAGVELVGYYDESSELAAVGKFVYWGFIANGEQDVVAEKIRGHVVDGERLIKDKSGPWGRSERRYVGDPLDQWRKEQIASDTVPKEGSVERVLIVEGDTPIVGQGRVAIECTMQGALTPALLTRTRPDLDEREMP
ncbi:hypothetical protein BGV68_33780 [Burkholderia ubonensis]|uniref:hypothetical protein n=1 Tax=Burkholderia ubonensis TaxID=101571 RepID=UPI0008FE9255|nr:hypothetical protein [Burkholderia ubonensis]OJA43476.1 hypothetical protein BGV68_33780 [Burkholderia ubonensis]